MATECRQHKLKLGSHGFVFCTQCGERWQKEELVPKITFAPWIWTYPTYPTYPTYSTSSPLLPTTWPTITCATGSIPIDSTDCDGMGLNLSS